MKTSIIKYLIMGLAWIAIPQITYSQVIEKIDQLIEIGNNNGTIEDDTLFLVAQKIYNACSRKIVQNESNRPSLSDALASSILQRSTTSKSSSNNKIYKELQNRKIHKRFIPYLLEYKNVTIQQLKQKKMEEEAEKEEGIQNLKEYYEAINRMQGKGASGVISVEKTERDYKGEMPFKQYYELKNGKGIDFYDKIIPTFLDEKFVYKQELDHPTDTFGLFMRGFINLRTGELFGYNDLINQIESITYLEKFKSTKNFTYNSYYSLRELLDYKSFYPEIPEKLCDALKGIEVYRMDVQDYDVIESVKVRRFEDKGRYRYDYKVEYQKNKRNEWWKNESFSIKWYEELKKYIGLKFIIGNKILYQEIIPQMPIWILENVELGYLRPNDRNRSLVATIRSGQETKRLDATRACMYITHEISDLYSGGNDKYVDYLLPYDHVKRKAIKMPDSVKKQIKQTNEFIKYLGESYKSDMHKIFNSPSVGTSLSVFLNMFPKAKLIKNTISGGKAIRVYHVNGYECVFKDGVCTSVNKI